MQAISPTMDIFSLPFQQLPLPTSPSGTSRFHEDLQRYVQEAILPVLQLDTQKSYSALRSDLDVLSFGSEGHKGPHHVHMVETFLDNVKRFTELSVPNQRVGEADHDSYNQSFLTIPSCSYHDFPRCSGDTHTLHGIVQWVVLYPLQTVRRLLQLCHWNMARLDLYHELDEDSGVATFIQWVRFVPSAQMGRDPIMDKSPLTVFVLAPWMFSNEDLGVFTEACPEILTSASHTPNDVERLWAKIRNVCIQNGSQFFVLTTYCGWVFGVFSEEYTHAWVSRVVQGHSQEPTILECLFYWLASATAYASDCVFEVPEAEVSSWDEQGHSQVDANCTTSSSYYVDPFSDNDSDDIEMDIDDVNSEDEFDVRCSTIGADDDVHLRKRGRWGYSDDGIRLWGRDVHASEATN